MYIDKIDIDHLLSREQIELVRSETFPGDEISFQKDGINIEGVIRGTYKNIFTFTDGRSFSWVEYILGSASVLHRLKTYHPIQKIEFDKGYNLYTFKNARTN